LLAAVWSVPAVALAVDYYLPWTQGSTILCTQGNGGAISHTGTNNRYAWDFGFSFGAPVRAAAPGTVIAMRQDAADFAPDPNLTTPVNYVLIAHSDGTRTGYLHLRYNSLPADIQVGAPVLQGQIIGGAGSSGFSSGVHLHFTRYDAAGVSIPLSFVEAGVPVGGTRYTSANAETGAPAPYDPIAPGDTGPPSVSVPSVSPSRPTHGKYATFTAWVSPGAGAVTGVSTLRLYRYETKTVRKQVRGRWRRVRVKYWRLRSTLVMTPDAAGRVSVRTKPRYPGRWKAQVYFSDSATHAASASGPRTFTVR
jgi:hypothetical protein